MPERAGASPHAPASRPPRPPWRDFGHLWRLFGSDLLGGLAYVHRRYGGFVRTRLPLQLYFVADPEAIEEVLVKQADCFSKDRTTHLLARVLGNGLLVNEGDSWKRQRRLIQPAFHHQQLRAYADLMVAACQRSFDGWPAEGTRDVHRDMMGLTLDIAARSLLGADISASTDAIGGIVAELMAEFDRLLGLAGRYQLPQWVPTPTHRRLRHCARRLDAIILGIVEKRRRANDTRGDLLSILVNARDEDGVAMSDVQIRDEAVTLLIAGHETTALMLCYALRLLAVHPECQERLADELDCVLAGRSPGLGDLEALRYADSVLNESMRLYPPAWGIARRALEPVTITGYPLPKGAELIMSPWVVHRDPRHFEEPERFNPERWEGSLARRLPRFAFFPFGGGPRVCIGNRFALMEAKIALAMAVQRFRFRAIPDDTLEVYPSVTLRPRHGVRLAVEPRKA